MNEEDVQDELRSKNWHADALLQIFSEDNNGIAYVIEMMEELPTHPGTLYLEGLIADYIRGEG